LSKLHKNIFLSFSVALVDEDSGEYILNGGFMVSIFRKLLLFGGATLEYSGSQTVIERVNSSSRPLKKNLILEVMLQSKLIVIIAAINCLLCSYASVIH
jgi:hypothetical protein